MTEPTPQTMRATVVSEYGDPEVLVVRDVPLPVPGPGQIRISVRAAGISPTDLHIRAGDLSAFFALPEPAILGFEAAGVVDALGDGVTGVSVGDEVAARLPRLGGYADFVLADAWTPKPESVSWEEAGSLPTAAEAAVAALRQLGVAKGDQLLVLGATGSVGLMAVQLARSMGATVIGSAPERDRAVVEDLEALFLPAGTPVGDALKALGVEVDWVLDAISAGGLEEVVDAVGAPGKIVTLTGAGAHGGVQMLADGVNRAADALDMAMPLLASGQLRMRPRETFPMAQAAAAHTALEEHRSHRKLVLVND
jgi:NADPH:quinone reductase-like Zn-dependent oxidoreductase